MPTSNKLYKLIRLYRIKKVVKKIDKNAKTILDIGCDDETLRKYLPKKYSVYFADLNPKNKKIDKVDVENMKYKNKQFDIVICQELLEHVKDPVKAMKEIKRVAKKQIIITVPYEPFFTLLRAMRWEKEHLWTISPQALKNIFGKPELENKIFFKRDYLGVWAVK
jgi:ubiquinone/menaquinone biosynthesis C-methylase UbiE